MRSLVSPDDLVETADYARDHLKKFLDRDWSVRAGSLEWDCRTTFDHIPTALAYYTVSLAVADGEPGSGLRKSDADSQAADLVELVSRAARVLAAVARSSPPDARGFHPAGLADAEGFLAMGCDEILIHTHDISVGMGQPLKLPESIAAKLVERLFPWAPQDESPESVLLWANDRAELPGKERMGTDWWWQCAPLDEWDGEVRYRTVPPVDKL